MSTSFPSQLSRTKIKWILVGADCLAILLAFFSSVLLAHSVSGLWLTGEHISLYHPLVWNLLALYFFLFIGILVYFSRKKHYSLKTSWWQQVKHILFFCLFAMIVTGFFSYALNIPINHLWVTLTWFMAFPTLLIFRWVGRAFLIKIKSWSIPTILIGSVGNTLEACYALYSEPYLRYDIKYIVLLAETAEDSTHFHAVYPDIEIREEHGKFRKNDYVIVCPDDRNHISLLNIVSEIRKVGARLALIPPIEGISLYDLHPSQFFGYGVVLLEPSVNIESSSARLLKYTMDKAGALLALFLLSPVLIFSFWKVRKDGGPALYGQTRIGKNGKPFKCWKFRSMVTNSQEILEELRANNPEVREEYDRDFKLKNDPRITKIGAVLRKTSLDELPQLFNVLRGDMSLVGPRPIVDDEKKYYKEQITCYMSVKPGMSGLWQVNGRSDITYAQRVYLDSWYVEHWSVWNDVVIIVKTVFVLLSRRGAY